MTRPTYVVCPRCGYEHEAPPPRNVVPNEGTVHERVLKLSQVSEILGLAKNTLRRYIASGQLKATRKPGHATPWLITESALADFRNQHSL
jgi:predicted DNA-binding transcriptional regulator AlpA